MTERLSPEIEELPTSGPLTVYLATSREGRPHVAPVWYRYEDGTVELTTTGRKPENVRSTPRVSLAVQKERAGVPEWTVTLLGTAEVIEDEAENRTANRRIDRKYGVDRDSWEGNTLVRVDVGSASYRTY